MESYNRTSNRAFRDIISIVPKSFNGKGIIANQCLFSSKLEFQENDEKAKRQNEELFCDFIFNFLPRNYVIKNAFIGIKQIMACVKVKQVDMATKLKKLDDIKVALNQ